MFPMYVKGKRVMVLSYKPKIDDVIRDDTTYEWYRVSSVEGRKVHARRSVDPRIWTNNPASE